MDALSELLSLPPEQKVARGLDDTPAEIAQQPDTWLSTDKLFHARRTEIKEFLSRSGVDTHSSSNVTIFLVGAGTSDYIGQSLAHLLRECWHSEVLAIPSTDLLTYMDDLMILERKYFWISFSRSGDSPEAKRCWNRRERRTRIFVISWSRATPTAECFETTPTKHKSWPFAWTTR